MKRSQGHRHSHDESGFTIVELVVAMTVTLIVLSALLGVFVQSLSTVTQAKQRQAATGLATQVMEQLRALPYDEVTQPTTSVAPTGDPNIAYETPPKLRPAAVPGVNEPLVVNTVSPKLTTHSLEGVNYQVRQYVARASAVGAQQPYTLSVLVTWTSNVSRGTKTTVERSNVYSASGCLSTATRPFSGPCQAYFTAQAGQTAAGITISNPASAESAIAGFDGRRAALALPLLSAGLLLEQTGNMTSSVSTTSAATTVGNALTESASNDRTVAVDSDPSSPSGQSESATTGVQDSAALSISGASVGTLTARPSSADAGTARAGVAAEPAQCQVGHLIGTDLTTGPPTKRRPCSTGNVQAAGSDASIQYTLPSALGGLTSTVVSVAASPSASRATAAHLISSNTEACPGTSGAGCAYAGARRALGTVTGGGLPTGAPAGFAGSWQLTGLVETALAERGTAARGPAYARAGALRYWNGSTYSQLSLAAGTNQDIIVPTATWSPEGQPVRLDVSSVLRVRPAQVPTPTGPADCQANSCFATASAPGGLVMETTYVLNVGGAEQTRFLVRVDLGGLLAEAAYKAAPGA